MLLRSTFGTAMGGEIIGTPVHAICLRRQWLASVAWITTVFGSHDDIQWPDARVQDTNVCVQSLKDPRQFLDAIAERKR